MWGGVMANAQKIILIAMAAVGLVCLVVGFSLMHYIGGFMRTVEEEARNEAESESSGDTGHKDETGDQNTME